MSKSVRSIPRDRMPQYKLDALINRPVEEQKSPRPILFSHEEYDTLHPEETLKNFNSAVRDMIQRYEGNKIKLEELEKEMQDLLHFIEMAADKNANAGYKLYKRLAEIRRERRVCKNELDLLEPVHRAFAETSLLNTLSQIQGQVHTVNAQISGRGYAVRTDVLDPFIN